MLQARLARIFSIFLPLMRSKISDVTREELSCFQLDQKQAQMRAWARKNNQY